VRLPVTNQCSIEASEWIELIFSSHAIFGLSPNGMQFISGTFFMKL